MSWAERLLFLECLLALAGARLARTCLPFRVIASGMGTATQEGGGQATAKQVRIAREVGRAVETMAKYTPFESNCLIKALAAQGMLRRRGIPRTIYFGVARDAEQPFSAHAWLECGQCLITGEKEHANFKVVARFTGSHL